MSVYSRGSGLTLCQACVLQALTDDKQEWIVKTRLVVLMMVFPRLTKKRRASGKLEDVRWNRSRLDVLVNWQRKEPQLKEGLKEVVEKSFR